MSGVLIAKMPIVAKCVCDELSIGRDTCSRDWLLVKSESLDFVLVLEVPKEHVAIGASREKKEVRSCVKAHRVDWVEYLIQN